MSIKNLVTQQSLVDWHPQLAKHIWSTQTTYQKQINLSFEVLMNRLHNANIDPEFVNPLLDLLNDTSVKSIPPVRKIFTSASTGSIFAANYQKRVVMELGAISGSFNIFIDGAKTVDAPAPTDQFFLATSFAVTSSYANSTLTQNTDSDYSWIRVRVEPSTGVGSTLTSAIYMTSPIFDNAIAHKALEIIFCDFRKEEGDSWDLLAKEEKNRFEEEFTAIKFAYDANKDGVIDPEESPKKLINITFTR